MGKFRLRAMVICVMVAAAAASPPALAGGHGTPPAVGHAFHFSATHGSWGTSWRYVNPLKDS